MTAALLPGVYRMTYADWLTFPDDGRFYELVAGELFVTPPPSVGHQRISREITFRLILHLRQTQGGEVLHALVGVRLSDNDVLEPDIVVVLAEHADRIGAQVIEGPPDLVIEILSPGSARRDLGVKRDKYESSGVAEYWIVDPESRSIEVLGLRADKYERAGLYRIDETLSSRVLPELRLPLGEIFGKR